MSRVLLKIRVEIDDEAWRERYSPDDLRADVKTYLESVVDDFLRQRELGCVFDPELIGQ